MTSNDVLFKTESLYGTGSEQTEVQGSVLMITEDWEARSVPALKIDYGCDFEEDWGNSTRWNNIFSDQIGILKQNHQCYWCL